MKDDQLADSAPLPADLTSWPKFNESCWTLGIIATIIAALLYLSAVWYVVVMRAPTAQTEKAPIIHITAPRGPPGMRGPVGPGGPRGPRGLPWQGGNG